MDGIRENWFRQAIRRTPVLRGKTANLIVALLFELFATTSIAQNVLETVAPIPPMIWWADAWPANNAEGYASVIEACNAYQSSSPLNVTTIKSNQPGTFSYVNCFGFTGGPSWANTGALHSYMMCPSTVGPTYLSYNLNWDTGLCERWVPANLTITLTGSSSVEPWHKKHDPNHTNANLPYKAIVKDQNGQPKANVGVTITTDVTSDSGGHVHTNGRHKGKLVDQVGATVSTKDGKVSIPGKTDGSGVFEFTFGAEEASGTHTLTAKCDSGCKDPATATVDVAIKGLQLLDAEPLAYNLVGSKEPHPHPGNHYFSPAAIVKTINLAHQYKKEFNQPEYKDNFTIPLVINDSSLIKGGTFDVLLDWTSESNVHGGHRIGIVVDINGIKKRNKDFEKFTIENFKIKAGWHKKGTAPHYHLLLLGEDH